MRCSAIVSGLGHLMEYSICHNPAITQVLDNDAFEELRCHPCIPDTFRIDHHDGASSTNAEARCFTAFDAGGSEEKTLTLKQRREQGIQRSAPAVGRAEAASANEHMARVWLHIRLADRRISHLALGWLIRNSKTPGLRLWRSREAGQ